MAHRSEETNPLELIGSFLPPSPMNLVVVHVVFQAFAWG